MAQVKIGWSTVNITPDKKISLAGQFAERISEYVEKPLTVTAMAVECGGDQMVMVSCDLVSITYTWMQQVRALLKDNREGLDPEKVMACAIHTHTGYRPGGSGRTASYAREGFRSDREVLEQYLRPGQKYVEAADTKAPDIMTMEECIDKPISECKLVFCGDTRNNVAYCLMYIAAKLGMTYVGYGPKELKPADEVMAKCLKEAEKTGAKFIISDDISAVKGADALYTDIWASMGEEDKIPERVALLTPFRVTGELLASTGNPDCIFLHCLPAFHDFETDMARSQIALGYDIREVTDEVFRGSCARQFQQAGNRMHTIKAVLYATLK